VIEPLNKITTKVEPVAILEVKKLSKDFGGLRAINQIDVDVQEGEILGVIGPNGSGKTTLYNLITGFLKPTEGQIRFKGKPITSMRSHEIAARGIGRTFQLSSIFSNLSVRENVIIGSHLRARDGIWGSFFRTKSYKEGGAELEQRVTKTLTFMGMEKQADQVAGSLPYGDQRKLELATTLALDPEILLLDEPATGMNPQETETMINLVKLIQEQGKTIVIVEHNMKVVMELCRRIVVLDYGVKIAEGMPEEVTTNEKVISVYLGRKRKWINAKS